MTSRDAPDLPLDLERGPDMAEASPKTRRWLHKRYLLVLLIPVFMFSGAVIGLYFQPPALQKFYALTGLQPGGGVAHGCGWAGAADAAR
jgi:HlyD family secretion protein